MADVQQENSGAQGDPVEIDFEEDVVPQPAPGASAEQPQTNASVDTTTAAADEDDAMETEEAPVSADDVRYTFFKNQGFEKELHC